ncbi:MAG: protein kinase [Thermoanaerobaculales bacterium]|nr:protein kinase [Thermoanaerobaculales bacterium]
MSITQVGRYQIEGTLGRGAMGIVYLARDPLIDRKVALKTLRLDVDAGTADEFRERFLREAQAAGRLNHPNIVTIHDIGEDRSSGVVYIAMEYIEGRDLKEIIATGHRFRPSETARIVADIAVALDYAHQMGVIHRDIKPGNLILTSDGSARIADFGIARMESSNLTVDGQFIGTPNFMSPEQINGLPLDGRSDLFSLGVVLFTLLTGRRPFTADTMHQVTRLIVEEPAPIPSVVDPSVPAAFNPIVMKCLDKDPDKRFQSGTELAQVLGALARSLVRREPGDDEATAVQDPDLGTRAVGQLPRVRLPEAGSGAAGRLAALWRRFNDRIVLPAPMTWEVQPLWAAVIIAGWAALWVLLGGVLVMQRQDGPFVSPSAGATRNLNRAAAALRKAEAALAAQRLDEARASLDIALDQAPASPAARRLAAAVARETEAERTSADTQNRVSELVAEGRRAYRAGRYSAAARSFVQALELDPQSEVAAEYLELSRERLRQAPRRPSSTTPARAVSPDLELDPSAVPAVRQQPGTARVNVYYNCPINAGTVRVASDGETVAEIPFDHTKKGFLGIKMEGRGTVKRVLLVPSGDRSLTVTVIDRKRGVLGSRGFTETLPRDSDWTLRIDQPKADAEPSFFFVKTSR